MIRRIERPPWKTALAVAFAVYAAAAWRRGVGLVNDDAQYILAARSLAGRHEFFRKLLDPRLIFDRLPGLPLLLAPLAAFARPPFDALKIYPLGLTLLSCALFWRLLSTWLEPRFRFAALILYAFNPLVVERAGRVMSEPLFICAALGCFLLTRDLLRHESRPKSWLLLLLLSGAPLIRGEGFLLVLSVAAAGWRARSRRVLTCALAAALAGGGFFLIGSLIRSEPSRYLGFWLGIFPSIGPGYWLRHALTLPAMFVWVLLGFPQAPVGAAAKAAEAALTLGALFVGARGLRALERSRAEDLGTLFAASLFSSLYFILHVLWPDSDPRFFLTLVPLACAPIVAGAAGWRRPWLLAGLSLWLLSYAGADARLVRAPAERAPARTLAWIDGQTPRTSRVWGFYDSWLVELYTGRSGVFMPVPASQDAFRYDLLSRKVDYLYYAPLRFSFEPVPGVASVAEHWRRSLAWVASSPAAYRPAYANRDEATAVYQVLPDPSFEKAYALYLDALERFRVGSWSEGDALLEESLRRRPDLASALNAYGATCLFARCDLPLARRRLEEAVRLQPDFALARENLERLPRREKPLGAP